MTRVPLLRVAAVAPGAVAGWLVAALPLVLLGGYVPVAWVLCCLPAAVVGAVLAWRATSPARAWWVPAALTLLVALAFGVLSWTTASPQVVVRRDAGSYAVTATWLAHHGGLPIPAQRSVFGGPAGMTAASPGFYARGDDVVPQFVTGLPLLAAPAVRLGGTGSAPLVDAVLGALAVLAVGALAARVGGPWAAPVGAGLLAVAYPALHAARTTLSEPAAQLLLIGGLGVLADALAGRRRWPLAFGASVVGLTSMVRIDALAELLPLLPFVVLQPRERRRPLALGLAGGVACGLVDGLLLTRPYLASLRGELLAVAIAAVVLVAGTLLVAWRRPRVPSLAAPAAAVAVVVGAVVVAVRPLVQTVRVPGGSARFVVAGIQAREGLPVDGSRTYVEQTGSWLAWWVGVPALVLALVALAVLVARAVRGRATPIVPFLLVSVGTAALVLWHPAITPDHPWADRRLVPVVLPAVAVLAAWSVTRAAAWVGRRTTATAAVVAGTVLAVVAAAPAAMASARLADERTEAGEPELLAHICRALPRNAAVVTVGPRAVRELTAAVRVRCGVPVATLMEPDTHALQLAAAAAAAHGRTLVALAQDRAALTGVREPRQVARLVTTEDARLLEHRPRATVPLVVEVWLAVVR